MAVVAIAVEYTVSILAAGRFVVIDIFAHHLAVGFGCEYSRPYGILVARSVCPCVAIHRFPIIYIDKVYNVGSRFITTFNYNFFSINGFDFTTGDGFYFESVGACRSECVVVALECREFALIYFNVIVVGNVVLDVADGSRQGNCGT